MIVSALETLGVPLLIGSISLATPVPVAATVSESTTHTDESRSVLPGEPAETTDRTRRVDLGRFFSGMDGTFVVLDARTGHRMVHDLERARKRFIPASTFKIPHSLIALETGIVDGTDFELSWDPAVVPPETFWPESWRRDQTLRSAFRDSVVWFYQELARRVGPDRMRAYLDRFRYGNRQIGGGIDEFWLRGDLRISPLEQTEFLHRLYDRDLGVSERTTALVEELMVLEETPWYRLSGKTGTAELTPSRELGWLVGALHTGDAFYLFALNMEGDRVWEDWPPASRTDLVRDLFRTLGLLAPSSRQD